MTPSGRVTRALLLGLATGGRATAGLTALALTARPSRPGPTLRPVPPLPSRLLTARAAGPVAVVAALGELVADKLPGTPSRLSPPALSGRLVAGALVGAALAQRHGAPVAGPAAAGLVGAGAGSLLGARVRAAAAARGRPDLVVALVEDAVVLGLARAGLRP